jgi:long-chain acyl-CoA synthetase
MVGKRMNEQIVLPEIQRPWTQFYDAHVPDKLSYPNISLVDLLNNSTKLYGNQKCIVDGELTFTYKEIGELSDRLACGLINQGLKKGDRVGIMYPNISQFIISYFAVLKGGGIVVAMNPFYKLGELIEMINITGLESLFCLNDQLLVINEIIKKCAIKTIIFSDRKDVYKFGQILANLINPNMKPVSPPPCRLHFLDLLQNGCVLPNRSPDDPAIFQFTGGTTGTPKAAIGLHRNLVANTYQFITWCNLKPGHEVIISAIPLYHVYGMVLAMCMGIALGSKIVLVPDPRNVEPIIKALENYHVTFFPGVPSMYYAIVHFLELQEKKINLRSIKACISGSSPLSPEIKNKFELLTGSKLLEGYGLSEAPTATHCNPLLGENKVGSIGMPLPDVDCRIVDLETGKRNLRIGSVGELIIKGLQVMSGYYQMPKETSEVLRNGWLFTGDVARMDKKGYFYIIDRKKSLIKVSGFQVWPNEIEKVISAHPKVQDVGVGGLPDLTQSEKVIAWVVLKPNQKLSKEEIREWCRQNLIAYKIPSEIIFRGELPRTSIGKVLRRELIQELLNK